MPGMFKCLCHKLCSDHGKPACYSSEDDVQLVAMSVTCKRCKTAKKALLFFSVVSVTSISEVQNLLQA